MWHKLNIEQQKMINNFFVVGWLSKTAVLLNHSTWGAACNTREENTDLYKVQRTDWPYQEICITH